MLQNGGRSTAGDLAQRLGVSERTVLRDLDVLSGAGVPVYGVRGPGGGFELLDTFAQTVPALPPRPDSGHRTAATRACPHRTHRPTACPRRRTPRRLATPPERGTSRGSPRVDRRLVPIRLLRHCRPRTDGAQPRRRGDPPRRTPRHDGTHRTKHHTTPQITRVALTLPSTATKDTTVDQHRMHICRSYRSAEVRAQSGTSRVTLG